MTRLDVSVRRGLVAAIGMLLVAVFALLSPTLTAAAAADGERPGFISIRLVDAPVERRDDPRALSSIVDHVAPGTLIERRVEIGNTTGRAQRIAVYDGPAVIRDGAFTGLERGEESELTDWTSVARPSVVVPAGATKRVMVRIQVPEHASRGERYAVVWAAASMRTDDGMRLVNRIGVRVYLSVGPGGEPQSSFEVSRLTASRAEDGSPVVTAAVANTGGRALDLAGELNLTEGPGSLAAGPFAAGTVSTLGPGDAADVRIVLDESLPRGPWHAKLDLASGRLQRSVEADLTFPARPGTTAPPVNPLNLWQFGPVMVGLGIALVVAVVTALGLRRFRGRPVRRYASDPGAVDA